MKCSNMVLVVGMCVLVQQEGREVGILRTVQMYNHLLLEGEIIAGLHQQNAEKSATLVSSVLPACFYSVPSPCLSLNN